MQTSELCEQRVSRLGFGAMRLPTLPGGAIDEQQVFDMVDLAMRGGVNYFDTAFPYHGGLSEVVLGKALARYPRESFYLATKYPGHQIASSYDPKGVFEEQLSKCGVDYFDFYLLHNVCESSLPAYTDPKWGIIDYFVEQKRAGRIRHLGFSSHARPETLAAFLDRYGDVLDFCQIQLNWLDWTLQNGKQKYELLTARNLPIIVMEPLRGGKLANLPADEAALLTAERPSDTPAAWGFNFLRALPNVRVILSGMSNIEQMRQNIETFSHSAPLTDAQTALLLDLAERKKDAVPCTACRYCTDGCPMGLDIPMLIAAYNDCKFSAGFTVPMQMDALDEDKRPSACLQCGACAAVCPQSIPIPDVLADFAKLLETRPKWADICREREEAEKRRKGLL
ncbi:MAG: aldo/keto reductase [Clostridia bacterium]|nr:aldo/keto reductase [Clostridia bacterium]